MDVARAGRPHDFRFLLAAAAISQAGTQVSLIALPLVAVVVLHASTFQTGLLATAQNASFLLIGLPAGAWIDRLRRRPVLIIADAARALLLGGLIGGGLGQLLGVRPALWFCALGN